MIETWPDQLKHKNFAKISKIELVLALDTSTAPPNLLMLVMLNQSSNMC